MKGGYAAGLKARSLPAAAYNAQDYLNLPVSKEVQDLFQLIGRSAGAAVMGLAFFSASLLLIGGSEGAAVNGLSCTSAFLLLLHVCRSLRQGRLLQNLNAVGH